MFKLMALSGLSAAALGAVAIGSLPAVAADDTPKFQVCREFASAAADSWSVKEIQRALDGEKTRSNTYVAVVYGKKYFVPVAKANSEDLKPKALGRRTLDRKEVFYEEFTRCLRDL